MKKLVVCFVAVFAFAMITPTYAQDGGDEKKEKKAKKDKKGKGKKAKGEKVELTGKLTKGEEGAYTLTNGDSTYTLKISKKIAKDAEGLVDKDVSVNGMKTKKGDAEIIMVKTIAAQ